MKGARGTSLPTIAAIQRAVAAELGSSLATMREPMPRTRSFANSYAASRPRQVAMALSLLLTNHSYTTIGRHFGGRDPTTVRSAASAVAQRRRADPKLHAAMRRISLDLVRGEA